MSALADLWPLLVVAGCGFLFYAVIRLARRFSPGSVSAGPKTPPDATHLGRSDLAGKTGTTNNFRDAWFSGFSPQVTTTVFVGFDEPAHLGRRESGASAALPIWVDYMGEVLPDFPQQPEAIPEQIVTRFINQESGELTRTDDPEGYEEYFLSGTEPTNPVNPLVDAGSPGSGSGGGESVTESLF